MSCDSKYLLKVYKRHRLYYIDNEKDINTFVNQYRSTFTIDSNTGLSKRSILGRKRLHNGLEDILLLKRQLHFNKRPVQQEIPLLQHIPTTILIEIKRLSEMSL